MKKLRSYVVRTLVLATLFICQHPVHSQQEDPDSQEISVAANAVISAFERRNVDQAFLYMTEQGAEDYLGMLLMEAISYAQADWTPIGASEDSEPPAP